MKCFLSDELINAVFSFHFIVYLCMWGAVRGVGRGGAFATYTNSMRTRGQAKSSALLGDNFIYRRSIKSVATFMFCLEFWSTHSHWHTDTHIPKHTTLYKTHTDAHWEDKKQEMRSEKERRETLSMSEGHWNGMLSLCASVRYIELARSYRYKTHTHTRTLRQIQVRTVSDTQMYWQATRNRYAQLSWHWDWVSLSAVVAMYLYLYPHLCAFVCLSASARPSAVQQLQAYEYLAIISWKATRDNKQQTGGIQNKTRV